uniref:Uncharacterized protein n=1 Tax=Panagrolaimus davidi TaxID=227884 RepID=A0A914Q7K2_9BILA
MQAEIYDELGRLQHRLHVQGQAGRPLNGWLHADFARMNFELSKMYEKKIDYEAITHQVARTPRDVGLMLNQDLCRREYERQNV